jgi:hypothetical protein
MARDPQDPSFFVALEGGAAKKAVRDAQVIRTFSQPVVTTSHVLTGRLLGRNISSSGHIHTLVFDVDAHRLSGASVAGLVVGVMGCFILGLYLKRWLGIPGT